MGNCHQGIFDYVSKFWRQAMMITSPGAGHELPSIRGPAAVDANTRYRRIPIIRQNKPDIGRRRPHFGSVRIDETYVKLRGRWRYLSRAIVKHANPIDFLLTAKRDLDAAKRSFRKMLRDERNRPIATACRKSACLFMTCL